ncbi:hypothetical protein ACVNF4_17015 [Streptomyces sp. S6]
MDRACDIGVSRATGYRYLHEGMTHVVLDGTLIESDPLAGVRDNGNDLWFSRKHQAFGGNIQFLSAPDGAPLWVSDAEPGPTPDITAARIHALPALYKAAAKGRSEQVLHIDTRTTNSLIRGVRALGERTAAELKERRRALKHVTIGPSRIGDITRAALVLDKIWK